jgi:hypothetical protein
MDMPTPENDPRVPSNLKPLVFKETPPEICPWSLSGPQFPTPTAIQQRYCYPKGDPEYSSVKGGALWTAYKENGAEDFDWRILHVYYSAKRAGNKGPVQPTGLMPPAKRSKLQYHLPMPKLETPLRRPKVDSFGSSFDDSPLSFNMTVSPLKDASLVSILSKTASIDTESEPIISPDRNFFDVQTEFEKANGIGEPTRHITREKKDKRSRSNLTTPSSHYRHYSSRSHWHSGYPSYWSPYFYPMPLFHSNSMDSHERQYQESIHAPSSSPNRFPIQETRKLSQKVMIFFISFLSYMCSSRQLRSDTQTPFIVPTCLFQDDDNVSKFMEELKCVQRQLMNKIENFRTHEKMKCKELLSVWGRQLARDATSSSAGSLLVTEAPKQLNAGREQQGVIEDLKANDSIDRDVLQL